MGSWVSGFAGYGRPEEREERERERELQKEAPLSFPPNSSQKRVWRFITYRDCSNSVDTIRRR